MHDNSGWRVRRRNKWIAQLLYFHASSNQKIQQQILRVITMEAVTGIFTSFDEARQSAQELTAAGFSDEHINLLTPGASEAKIDSIPSTTGEQPSMGKAVGGVVGAATGTAAGAPLGLSLASAFVPGVGPAIAIGLAASALLGIVGAIGGAAVG